MGSGEEEKNEIGNKLLEPLKFMISDGPTENVNKILNPSHIFKGAKDIEEGSGYEICSEGLKLAKDIAMMLAIKRGMTLIFDYGEDHALQNSLRVYI